MNIRLEDKNFDKINSNLEIIFVLDNNLEQDNIKHKDILKKLNFKGNDEEVLLLVAEKKLYVGCVDLSYDSIAIAISTAIRKFQTTNFNSIYLKLFDDDTNTLKALVEGSIMGAYSYNRYKSKTKIDISEDKEFILLSSNDKSNLMSTFKSSVIIANSVNKTRDFVNATPEDFYPKVMFKESKKIAKDNKISIKVYGEEYLEKNGMNAMLSVGRASRHESQLIHMTYKPKKSKIKSKIVLVGKGLTYDSGGLSLKGSSHMVTMKSDKSGACSVMGMMDAISKLNLPIEVHAILGAVENMIGGDAYKPDDVLIAKNKDTIEVRNTDAEGRLVLADCLCYTQDNIKNIDYIFDFATLTGACVVGLGEYTTGIMGNNANLRNQAIHYANIAGEEATFLPFNRHLKKLIKSNIADISNVASSSYGGSITAGLFLENFIYKEYKDKWLHFDIAGPAYVEKAWGYNPFGGSGAGVRMIVEFLRNIK
jgi:leucyl aminopeptidase